MWSEVLSAVRRTTWRGEITVENAALVRARLSDLPVAKRDPGGLSDTAWAIAEELGWAKTYDAEYLALARLAGGRVVTLDGRMLRGAERTGLVVGLAEVV